MTRSDEPHLGADALARYLDGTAADQERAAIEAHLADCLACQEELAAVHAVVRTAPSTRPAWRLAIPLAAAAAVALLILAPQLAHRVGVPQHRAPAAVEGQGPSLLAPVGGTRGAGPLTWSRVNGADRYRVTLFDAEGSPLLQESTADTTLALPAGVLGVGVRYHWKVEARVGIDRWSPSRLADFVFAPGPPR